MTPDQDQPPPIPLEAMETVPSATAPIVTESRRCITCSYELMGLPTTGVCPECGTGVALSLRDNLLVNSSPTYLATIHKGVFLIQTGIIVMIVGFILMMIVGFSATIFGAARPGGGAGGFNPATVALVIMAGIAALTIIPTLIGLFGWYKFSEPDPRASELDRGEKPRRIVRTTVIVEVILVIASQVTSVSLQVMSGWGTGPGVGIGLTILLVALTVSYYIAIAVRFFASMLYIRWLAPRVPNEKAFNRAKQFMWLGPLLCTVGALACYIGPLVALVLYYNLLDWMRLDIKRIRAVAEARMNPTEQNPSEPMPA
ncbi:MAG: hypothetical protein ACKVZJ_07815 [Phycisphaerales bacterium]